ncbi:MAG: hypothetical protein IT518_24790 [Burkholderiales bacterium]|nr:hypothetical protein [Burkholderiales bacterium]
MDNDPVVIVGAARTPMGGLSVRRSLRSLNLAAKQLRRELAHAETTIGDHALGEVDGE